LDETLGTPKNSDLTLPATPGNPVPVPKSMTSLRKNVLNKALGTPGTPKGSDKTLPATPGNMSIDPYETTLGTPEVIF
jgi:hypothetical protein